MIFSFRPFTIPEISGKSSFLEAERILEERGYTIISDEEAEEMLQEFRESAGFTEEIYNAEVAYYGD